MMSADAPIRAAEVVLPCGEINDTLRFFTERLGFRVDTIIPADDPTVAVVSGHGLRLRLQRGAAGAPGVLRLLCSEPAVVGGGTTELTAPNGTRVELVEAEPPLVLPPLRPSFVLSRAADARWGEGRAGMRYRDLIPDRQGGRFIASHIQIPDGGPVPDYEHFHKIRFQMIYCYRGWVRVVYEDQGPPFVLHAGDCVLQPPQIRHRVLECSPGLEVIELGSPADHETWADHEMTLPTGSLLPDRDFGGQRFVRHQAADAEWTPWRAPGFEARDLGMEAATGGVAAARVARVASAPSPVTLRHDAELLFLFLLAGEVTLRRAGHEAQQLRAGDSVVLPADSPCTFDDGSADLELLEVTLPPVPC